MFACNRLTECVPLRLIGGDRPRHAATAGRCESGPARPPICRGYRRSPQSATRRPRACAHNRIADDDFRRRSRTLFGAITADLSKREALIGLNANRCAASHSDESNIANSGCSTGPKLTAPASCPILPRTTAIPAVKTNISKTRSTSSALPDRYL